MSLRIDIGHRIEELNLSVALSVESGVTALFGPSGSGKTTVLKAISGLLHPDDGKIDIAGRSVFDREKGINVPTHKRQVGYVFQDARLFPHLTVKGNLEYAYKFADRGRKLDRKIVDLFGIGPLLERRIDGLSGGERQRVAIARALFSDPKILLLDEPMAALDEPRKREIFPYLERLRDEAGLPIIYVSHSLSEVARLASQIATLKDGKMASFGATSDVMSNPTLVQDLGIRTAGSVLRAQVENHFPDGISELRTSVGSLFIPSVTAPLESIINLRILARDVIISLSKPENISALNILPAKVVSVKKGEGPGTIVELASGEDRILARITSRSAETLGLSVNTPCFAIIKSLSINPGEVWT